MNRLLTAGAGLALIASPLAVTTATASDGPQGASARQAAAYSVRAKLNRTTAVADEDVVRVRGKVSPRAAGERVILQQRSESKNTWSVSGKARIKPSGKFVLKDHPSSVGTRFYRVVKPAEGRLKKGVSRELEVVVYGWERLALRAKGPSANVRFEGATIATESFPHSIVTDAAGTPAAVEYTLGRKCLVLRSTYALTDASASGGTGSVVLKADGEVAFASALTLGQVIEDQVTDISGAFRIRYDLGSSATPASSMAAATPEVLCTK